MAKRCCCCLTSILILLALIAGILLGVGAWAYGKFAEPRLGVKFFDALGLVGGAYSANEKKIVTNPYAAADLDGFMSNFKKGIFVSEDTDVTVSDIMNGLVNKGAAQTSGGTFADGTENTGNVSLDDLLNRIKFDFSSLENYDGSPHLLQITDRQLAALLNEAIVTASSGFSAVRDINEKFGTDIGSLVKIRQVSVEGAEINAQENARLSITFELQIKEFAKAALSAYGQSGLSWLTFLLPKRIFITAAVYPKNPSAPAEVTINNYSAKQKENLALLLNKVEVGGASLLSKINGMFVTVLNKVENYMPLYYVNSELETQPVTALLKLLKIDGNVSEGQFLSMVSDIKFVDKSGVVSGDADYAAAEKSALNIIKAAYGIPESASVDLLKDGAKLIDKIDMRLAVANDAGEPTLTDEQFAALLKSALESSESVKDLHPVMANAEVSQKDGKTTLALVVEVDFYKLLTEGKTLKPVIKNLYDAFLLTSEKDADGNFVSQKFYLEADVVMSGDYPVKLRINGMTDLETQDFVNTVKNIAVSVGGGGISDNLDLIKLSEKLSGVIKSSMDKVKKALPVAEPLKFGEGSVKLPGVYDLMKGVLKLDSLQSSDVRDVMRGIYELDAVENALGADSLIIDEARMLDALNAFLSDFRRNYFLKNAIEPDKTFERLNALASGINADNFVLKGADGLLETDRATEDLSVLLVNAAFAGLLGHNAAISFTSSQIESTAVTGAKIETGVTDTIVIAVRAKLKKTLADGTPEKYGNFKPDFVYITASVDMSAKDAAGNFTYPVQIKLNDMTDKQMNDFVSVINSVAGTGSTGTSGSSLLNLDKLKDDISANLKTNMSKIRSNGTLTLGFTAGGIVFPSVFELVRDALFTPAEREAETQVDGVAVKLLSTENFRAALQGMNDLSGYNESVTEGGVTRPKRIMNSDLTNAPDIVPPDYSLKIDVVDTTLTKLINDKIAYDAAAGNKLKVDGTLIEQTILGAASANSSGLMKDAYSAFGIDTTKDFLLVTARVPLTGFAPTGGNAAALVPEFVYASLIIFKDGGSASLLNNLGKKEQMTLELIANKVGGKSDTEKLNLGDVTNEIHNTIMSVPIIRKSDLDPTIGSLLPGNITVETVFASATFYAADAGQGIGKISWRKT